MSAKNLHPGYDANVEKGWWQGNKWLVLRRLSQLGILGLFMVGPLSVWYMDKQAHPTEGFWIVKGTLASSLTLDVLPMTDPFMALQGWLGGHSLEQTALTGVAIVIALYLLVGGRAYCSWVCPVNLVSDVANWLRRSLGIEGGLKLSRKTRYWVMVMTLLVSAVTGSIIWELVNPITILYRGILFGVGLTWTVVLGVFLYDLFVAPRGWCSHLCPVGAFYGLIGRLSIVKVGAMRRQACNNCLDCFAVCPEKHVISPALKGEENGIGPVIMSADCTNCGRCIDVCAPDVFEFTTRFRNDAKGNAVNKGSSGTPNVAT